MNTSPGTETSGPPEAYADPPARPRRLDPTAVTELRKAFRGQLLEPGAPGYEQHRRVWNGAIDRFPALIARCADEQDVVETVRLARRLGVAVAVRGGGHSFAGWSTCDGGLVIDLSAMAAIRLDPDGRTVTVQPGVRIGQLDERTQSVGRAVPAGVVSRTGIAGLTLGGGIGWLMRKYGLTLDQLVSARMVTAAGDVVQASLDENRELFWGLRGAGANFGVVTEFRFRTQPVGPEVLAGPVFWPMELSAPLLRFYRDWISEAPDELTTAVVHRRLPSLPSIPRGLHGRAVVSVVCCYCGPAEQGERMLRSLLSFRRPLLSLCRAKPYVEHQRMFDTSFPDGWWYYHRACDVESLTDEVIEITADRVHGMRSPHTAFPIYHLGGAVGRVGADETAFNGRSAGHVFNINATTTGRAGFEEERAWARSLWSALRPHQRSVYVNFLMDEGRQRVEEAYGAATFRRLQALKRTVDPDNVFRLNQNVPPG